MLQEEGLTKISSWLRNLNLWQFSLYLSLAAIFFGLGLAFAEAYFWLLWLIGFSFILLQLMLMSFLSNRELRFLPFFALFLVPTMTSEIVRQAFTAGMGTPLLLGVMTGKCITAFASFAYLIYWEKKGLPTEDVQ